jgi:hypothetical protein
LTPPSRGLRSPLYSAGSNLAGKQAREEEKNCDDFLEKAVAKSKRFSDVR